MDSQTKSPAHRTGRQKGDGRVITNHQYKYTIKFDYESIVRHRVDQLTAGRYADQLAVAAAADDVGQAMLKVIKRRGLLPELFMELDLCDLCRVRRAV